MRLAKEAADLYQAIHDRTGGYYPGINAATLMLISGRPDEAKATAQRMLWNLKSLGPANGLEGYYRFATEAEAHLILGELERVRAACQRAFATFSEDLAAIATTRRQLRLLCTETNQSTNALAELVVPTVIHYCGHMISGDQKSGRFDADMETVIARQIEQYLAENNVGFGYGSLACGADIIFAEALLHRKAELHVILPFNQVEFLETSVIRGGKAWKARFESCLGQAASINYTTDDSYMNDDHLYRYASQYAMGAALLRARYLDTSVEQVAVWDGVETEGATGTSPDVMYWRSLGHRQRIITSSGPQSNTSQTPPDCSSRSRTRVPHALLFSDIKGFSKLTEHQLSSFIDGILQPLAIVLGRHEKSLKFRNTWGDGLFLIFDDVSVAAECALDLQRAMRQVDLLALGLPDSLGLRLGGHYGPVFEAVDPLLETVNYFGNHVSRAARIEPITPEGCVYITEAFAACLALEAGEVFSSDYVGNIPAAKGYGDLPMYLLREIGRNDKHIDA